MVVSSTSYGLAAGQHIEVLQLAPTTGSTTLNLIGNELDNTLRGNAGANMMNSGAGVDKLYGLTGNNHYAVHSAADRVFESANEGSDLVVASASYELTAGQHVEVLQLAFTTGNAALNLTGNELGNAPRGNAGANVVNGRAGADTLYGLDGADTFAFSTQLGADQYRPHR